MSIVETLKEYHNILLGHEIVVHTNHKNLVYKHFNTKRVMRWRLLLEEFGPKLLYIKGEQNIVANALSRLDLSEEVFAPDLFAFDEEDFPSDYPLSYTQIMYEQSRYPNFKRSSKAGMTSKRSRLMPTQTSLTI